MRRIARGRLLWTVLFAIALGVLVLLLVLIGVGYLRLPAPAPTTLTVTQVDWTIEQGTTASGGGWFGASSFNQTGPEGYPATFNAGSTIKLIWSAFNRDSVAHTVYSVTVSAPFTFVSSSPGLPMSVPAGDDSAFFDFSITSPSGTTGSYVLMVTVNALTAPS